MVIDHISNLIIKIKNAGNAGNQFVEYPHSKLCESVSHVLKNSGYVKAVEIKGKKNFKTLVIEVSYNGKAPRISGVERVSKLSRRVYRKAKDIKPFKNGFGNVIYSTPKGVLIDMEAKKLNVGGEMLFRIW